MMNITINTKSLYFAVVSVKSIINIADIDATWSALELWANHPENIKKIEEEFLENISRYFLGNTNMIRAAKGVLAAGSWTNDGRWGCNFLLPATADVLANIR